METGKKPLAAILYYAIGCTLMLLVIRDLTAVLVCTLAAGFLLAGALLWRNGFYVAAGICAVIIYIRSASLIFAVVVTAVLLLVVLITAMGIGKKNSLSKTVAITTLAVSVFLFAAGAGYLYYTQGSLNTDALLAPAYTFSASLDKEVAAMAKEIAVSNQMSAQEIDQYISDALTYKEALFDNLMTVLPALAASTVMIGTTISLTISKLLLRKKYADIVTTESLKDMKLSKLSGGSYLVCYLLSMLIEGTFGVIMLNYAFILQFPLLAEGVMVTYRFFTRRAKTGFIKVLAAVAITITCVGATFNLSWIYTILGALDTYVDFRAKLKGPTEQL